jgi:hypothetical protein
MDSQVWIKRRVTRKPGHTLWCSWRNLCGNKEKRPRCSDSYDKQLDRQSIARSLFAFWAVCLALFVGDAFGQSPGYQYSQTIVLNHAQVPNTDQTDFPVLISGTYLYLATVANGGQVQNSQGYDIIFTSDAAGTNQLDHEIDSYNPATGAVAFWVRIPTLSHTADTTIYMSYGNPNITTSQENKPGVWRNSFLSVYHFGGGGTVGMADSSSSGYNLSGSASAVSGVIAGGVAFSGDPSTYLYDDSVTAYPSGTSPVTFEAWIQLESSSAGEILGYGANSPNGSRDALYWDGSTISMEMDGMGVAAPISYDNNCTMS